ncbi:hypothetical protein LCGC14_1000720 [marine sediment metagenome]|uniref:Uncharacterized protein n=1 Tax=marine sediment metagenome TaxID=412755 RepID=A0A0F9N361_9ZZZZ
MKTHNLASIFPMMNEKEFKELKEDIKQNGLIDTIITFEEKILDGRNRYNACKELGVEPKFKEYKGSNPLQFIISTNLKRRHLNESQKAIIGERIAELPSGVHGTLISVPTQEQTARMLNIGVRAIQSAREIRKKKPEEIIHIESGKKKIGKVIREIKLEEQKKDIEKVKEITGEYNIIVVDPPWSYGDDYDEETNRGTTPYPTMSLNEIRNIKLPTKKDCILWLWTTNTFIEEALELINVWGFKKKSIVTWDKKIMGMGRWLRSQTEHCILATKGKPYFNNKKWTTLISEKRTTHSTKPEIFYKMVEEICAGRKLDYFARKKRKGWDIYGDEVK